MSMMLGLVTLDDANIARLLADPPLVWQVLAPDDPERYEEGRRQGRQPGVWGRLLGRKAPPEAAPPDLQFAEGELARADLDKAWHGIHYLLTGTAWEGSPPLNFLVSGGREVGRIDVGYGPARVLTAAEVAKAHHALEGLTDEALRARFRPDAMMSLKIYPEIWDRAPDDDDTLGFLMDYVSTLRSFLREAVDGKRGLVISVS
jgi:hypothetical protein